MADRPPPTPPNTVDWRVYGKSQDVSPWCTSWHLILEEPDDYSYTAVHRLHEDLLTLLVPFLTATMASAVTCDLSRLNVTGPSSSVGDTVFINAAGARGSPLAAHTAVPVRQIVQAAGRGRQGRFWLPPPAFSDTQFGFQLTPGAASWYAGGLTFMFDEINTMDSAMGGSVRFCVIHRQEHGTYLDAAVTELVDTWVLSRLLGTQRRRLQRTDV